MLYSSLLIKIDKFIAMNPDDYGSQTVMALAKESNRSVHGYLFTTNILDIGTLRKIIPAAFPKAMRTGPLVGNCNNDDVWIIMPMSAHSKGVIL